MGTVLQFYKMKKFYRSVVQQGIHNDHHCIFNDSAAKLHPYFLISVREMGEGLGRLGEV